MASLPKKKHIALVQTSKSLVIEFQYSSISPSTIVTRQKFSRRNLDSFEEDFTEDIDLTNQKIIQKEQHILWKDNDKKKQNSSF